MNKSFIFILSTILVFFSVSPFVVAEVKYESLAPIEGVGDAAGVVSINENTLENYFKTIYRMGIALATGLAVLMIVLGGIEYITTDAIGGKEEGKEKISNAIMGLLLALGSFIILRTIDPNLVSLNFNIKEVDQGRLNDLAEQAGNLEFPDLITNLSQMPAYTDLGDTSNLGAAPGVEIQNVKATYYYILEESKYAGLPKNHFFSLTDGSKIPANVNFVNLGTLEGTVKLQDGRVLNFVSNNKWKLSSGWGEGAYRPLTPWRSIAVDSTVIAPRSKVYIKEFVGLQIPNTSKIHDGVFFADDIGSRIKGNHIDVFTGTQSAGDQAIAQFSNKPVTVKILEKQ